MRDSIVYRSALNNQYEDEHTLVTQLLALSTKMNNVVDKPVGRAQQFVNTEEIKHDTRPLTFFQKQSSFLKENVRLLSLGNGIDLSVYVYGYTYKDIKQEDSIQNSWIWFHTYPEWIWRDAANIPGTLDYVRFIVQLKGSVCGKSPLLYLFEEQSTMFIDTKDRGWCEGILCPGTYRVDNVIERTDIPDLDFVGKTVEVTFTPTTEEWLEPTLPPTPMRVTQQIIAEGGNIPTSMKYTCG